ncbi:NtaA/DmoA family FMN-dependent monooxygenase [Cryobacterium arcticum]|uniref:Luciferase-like domain-containing protein n=1 Tax=Cryobacterium arcticum TaxID=670052 RepID=A0A318A7V6_9MICO|nr:NtaA/DmoA family FMN-dependent monooxygenase [Cryobacterium arcticum]PXA73273.1 hypothetical protein CTB96_00510 [Cryobacterium arcticum]
MKPFILGVFQLMNPNGMSGASWRHPDNTSLDFMDIDYWVKLAAMLEEAKFDFLFLADTYGTPIVDGEIPAVALEQAMNVPTADPVSLMSALAVTTTKLGLVVTSATTFEPPYAHARRFSTLDHFSRGRIGWNMVTGASAESAAKAFGQPLTPHDKRYDMGDDYLDLTLKLWEGSWEDGAVIADKAAGIYADASRVHRVVHRGEYYSTDCTYQVIPSPQRTPVLFQAGSSGRGLEFAARNAECVFLQGTSLAKVAASVTEIHAKAQGFGRAPGSVKILVGLSVFTAPTHEEAVRKYQDLLDLTTDEFAAAAYVANTGINLLALDPSQPLPKIDAQQGQSNVDRYRSQNGEKELTVREILDEFKSRGLRGLVLVGTPEEVADQMEDYADQTGLDGFLFEPHIVPGTYTDIIDLLLPVLRERGRAATEYGADTLRERIFPGEGPRLAAHHPGAAFRPEPAPAQPRHLQTVKG